MHVFQSIQDADVIRCIAGATKRVVYVAPGLSSDVGAALQRRMKQGDLHQIVIILDADEETCRLGYCDAAALENLSMAAAALNISIRRQPGLRLGLLVADDQVLAWAPAPLMFEAERTRQEPNGLVISSENLSALLGSPGIEPDGSMARIETGTQLLTTEEVAHVVKAIKEAPPAPFNLSRLSRVFSAKFQFIETVLRGAELTRREMRLDSLIINADAPDALRPLLQTTIQPFTTDADKTIEVPVLVNCEQAYRKNGEPITKPTSQTEVHGYWTELMDRYVVNLPGYGKIIRQTDKVNFEAGKKAFVEVLTAWVTGFRELVKVDHEKRVSRIVALIEQRMQSASQSARRDSKTIEELVRKGLDNLRVIAPEAKVVYKNITVESTKDEEFLNTLRKVVPAKELDGWFHIFDAAPMVQVSPER